MAAFDNSERSAFPTPENCFGNEFGLTKREMIAAMCLQGLLSDNECSFANVQNAAKCAIEHADALLVELEKEQ